MVSLLFGRALDGEPDRDVIAGNRFITNGPNRAGAALKITQLSHREIDENGIHAGQRVDGAVTPNILTSEKTAGQFQQSGRRRRGGRQRG